MQLSLHMHVHIYFILQHTRYARYVFNLTEDIFLKFQDTQPVLQLHKIHLENYVFLAKMQKTSVCLVFEVCVFISCHTNKLFGCCSVFCRRV